MPKLMDQVMASVLNQIVGLVFPEHLLLATVVSFLVKHDNIPRELVQFIENINLILYRFYFLYLVSMVAAIGMVSPHHRGRDRWVAGD